MGNGIQYPIQAVESRALILEIRGELLGSISNNVQIKVFEN
jgi:hypothetical protein